MKVEPVGMPAAMKAWRERQGAAVLTLRCGAAADCDAQVGAVYESPDGYVVESWLAAPQAHGASGISDAPPEVDLETFADELGVVGLLDDFSGGLPETGAGGSGGGQDEGTAGGVGSTEGFGTEGVRAQVDLLGRVRYWQNPKPVCPHHGELPIDRTALYRAVRQGEAAFEVPPG